MPAALSRGRRPSAIAVFAALASYANNTTGAAHPSLATLVADTGLSRNTLDTHLKWLREEGWVRWQVRSTRFGRQRFYTVWTPSNGMGGSPVSSAMGSPAIEQGTRPTELPLLIPS
jgi:DNA-binding transcriptional MocR family regulator